MDLVLLGDVDQALELVKTLDSAKFAPLVEDVESVARSAFIVRLIHQQAGIQLNLAVGVSGFEQQIVNRAARMTVAEQEISVATSEDLLLMKLLAGRGGPEPAQQ